MKYRLSGLYFAILTEKNGFRLAFWASEPYNQICRSVPMLEMTSRRMGIVSVSHFSEQKPNQEKRISFNENKIRSVLPKDIKDYKIEEFVIKAIENYSKTLALERGDQNDLEI